MKPDKVNKLVAKKWNELSKEERIKYESQSTIDRSRYAKQKTIFDDLKNTSLKREQSEAYQMTEHESSYFQPVPKPAPQPATTNLNVTEA